MTTRVIARTGALLISALLAAPTLAACGGSSDDTSDPQAGTTSEAPAADTTSSTQASPAQTSANQANSASLTWPQGSDNFALNVCTSVGEHTIMGGGDSDTGKWNLSFDANLLAPGDTGTLTVSQKSDMSVVYDADITALSVAADGSFTGSGEDAAAGQFTITGTCDVSW